MTHSGVSLAIPDLSHFTSCALLLYVGVYSKSVQSSEAGDEKNTSDSLSKFFPPLGMLLWLEQGILRGLGAFIPQVRGIPVNTTGITQGSDNLPLPRNQKLSIFNPVNSVGWPVEQITSMSKLDCYICFYCYKRFILKIRDIELQIRHVEVVIMKNMKYVSIHVLLFGLGISLVKKHN